MSNEHIAEVNPARCLLLLRLLRLLLLLLLPQMGGGVWLGWPTRHGRLRTAQPLSS